MKFKRLYLIVLALLGLPLLSRAQFTNNGSLHVQSNTDLTSLQVFMNMESGEFVNDGNLMLHDDYINRGIVSFSPDKSTGTTNFIGSVNKQNISGVVPMLLCNVDFKNSSGSSLPLILSGQMNIFGNANFTRGVLDSSTNDAKIIFEKGSGVLNVSDKSYVQGAVYKIGNEAFDFPVGGQNAYRRAGISAPSGSTDEFSVKYFYEAPKDPAAVGEDIKEVDNKEYWIISKENASSDIILTLTWDDSSTTPSSIVENPENITIVRWDDKIGLWVDESGVADKVNRTISTPASIKNYGIFTLASKKSDTPSSSDVVAVVYNAISANGDGINDYLRIDGLENTQNTVTIFNRWGAEVYKTANYGTNDNVFTGKALNKGFIGGSGQLPSGTYFYLITFTQNGTGKTGKKVGYLYIN